MTQKDKKLSRSKILKIFRKPIDELTLEDTEQLFKEKLLFLTAAVGLRGEDSLEGAIEDAVLIWLQYPCNIDDDTISCPMFINYVYGRRGYNYNNLDESDIIKDVLGYTLRSLKLLSKLYKTLEYMLEVNNID